MAYTNRALVTAYLGSTGTGDDALIDTLIEEAESLIDTYTGQTFFGDGTSVRYFDAVKDVDGPTLFFDAPTAAISSVVNRADDSTGSESITSAQYVTLPRNATPYYGIRLLASANKEWDYQNDPEAGIEVTAKWVYSTAAPTDIQHAATRLAAWLYRQKDSSADLDRPILTDAGVTILPSDMPRDVQRMIEPYRRRHIA